MKKFILLFMLVFGINTAVNAQTKVVITDDDTKEQVVFELDKDLTESEISDAQKNITTSYNNNTSYGRSFSITIIRWDFQHGTGGEYFMGSFNFGKNDSIYDIEYELLRIFRLM